MIESLAFQTRARTVDHLGREQIADCPTAVSELWKNAYDAYARNVGLNIYDGKPAIATIVDDGHGMNRKEFIERWLVLGTESKVDQRVRSEEDLNGLEYRTKQGQKGIGRLSSANLGPLLLVVSKRWNSPFVAALIDWRLFENPYLFLLDVEIPVVEFDEKHELLPLLPGLFDLLMSNVWGSRNTKNIERDRRNEAAWKLFSDQETSEGKPDTTQSRIEATVIGTVFEERHFAEWPLWKGEQNHGTILAISDIQFDLEAQLSRHDAGMESAVEQAREQLFQTLANFTDPFLDEKERKTGYGTTNFMSRVTVWEGNLQRNIIDEYHPFDLEALLNTEHVVDGEIDEKGVFRGRIKAFNVWLDGEVTIPPPIDIPTRKDSIVGPFHLRIGTFEQEIKSTTLSEEVFRMMEDRAKQYAGFSVYRNGLRVMPYGREGNDFFRIEQRRTKHAGREFWSLRRLFGRVALRKEQNPNLRDKAGREGLIDNRAVKTFRDLVENILKTTARNYFGSDADLRKKTIPDRQEEYVKQKAEEARNKQRAQNRKRFRANLDRNTPILASLMTEIEALVDRLRTADLQHEEDVVALRTVLQDLKRRFQETSLGEAPRTLGTLEERYLNYRRDHRRAKELLDSISDSLDNALERIKPRSAKDIAYSELNANAAFLHKRLRAWAQEAKGLLNSELERIVELQNERNKAYHAKTLPLIDDVEHERIPLRKVSEELEQERDRQDAENAELFEPYISALNSLKERIDLAGLAHFNQDQADELREEVDQLHGLAQLGITVEIIGHEIEGLEQTISANLKAFPDSIQQSEQYFAVKDSYEALVERLRYLSPLKLSGHKTRANLTGKHIFEYVQRFFRNDLADEDFRLEATPAFLSFSVFEQSARIYPVFINLLNNAAYWVNHSTHKEKKILLDAVDGKVVVADTGPGVDEEDRKHLFRLFFTRKVRGGRGVGLYLCRTNLAAGGHTIVYADKQQAILPGANFLIDFKGAKYE
ncbi:MAG: ATP-binding protein [Pseudomonadota bacterium]